MKFHSKPFSPHDSFECILLPFWEGVVQAAEFSAFHELIAHSSHTGDFRGKVGETLLLYERGQRVLLFGLGKEDTVTAEGVRRSVASAIRIAQNKKVKKVHVVLPHISKMNKEDVLRAVAEGIFLTNYAFTSMKHDSLKENPSVLLEEVIFLGEHPEEALNRWDLLSSSVKWVRDLINKNADEVTPQFLAEQATHLAKASSCKVNVLGKKEIEREEMGLLLAVNRGSALDPALITLSYHGNAETKEHIVLVGKGITYDTGGLNLKPADGMLTMKCDMAGAATVLAAAHTAAQLKLKVNVTAVVPTTENAIDARSYKQGDVYRAKTGKTVEITNTDAEGRLVLADAIAYTLQHLHPTVIIDVATLTGGVIIALGEEVAGLFSNNDGLAKDLLHSSESTGESIWRLPLPPDYKEMLKSEIADLVNSAGRSASSITAALFLQEFVSGTPWAHLDVAGTAYLTKPKYYNTTKATGFGVRLLVDFLERRSNR